MRAPVTRSISRVASLMFLIAIFAGMAGQGRAAEPHRRPVHRGVHRQAATQRPAAKRPAAGPRPRARAPAVNANSSREVVEAVEPIESVEPVEATPALTQPMAAATAAPVAGPQQNFWLRTVGRLHAASVHLPIAWTVLWILAEVVAPALGAAPLATAALPLGIVTCLSFAPSMASGWLRLGELSLQPGYDVGDGVFHRNVMLAAGAVLTVALLLRLVWAFFPARPVRHLYILVLLGGMFLMSFGAHLGGRLVYGDDFLPF